MPSLSGDVPETKFLNAYAESMYPPVSAHSIVATMIYEED
jgi:hypothetical protein